MKLIIAGSRDISESEALVRIDRILSYVPLSPDQITEVVSGGARGPDRAGELWAQKNNIKLRIFFADWNMHGKAAGPLRNIEMAKYVGPEGALLPIWGRSEPWYGSYGRDSEEARPDRAELEVVMGEISRVADTYIEKFIKFLKTDNIDGLMTDTAVISLEAAELKRLYLKWLELGEPATGIGEYSLEREEKNANLLVSWFHSMYERPEESLPRVDGEWAWITGGPYTVQEVLGDPPGFSGRERDIAIQIINADPEHSGTMEWAKKTFSPDFDGAPPIPPYQVRISGVE